MSFVILDLLLSFLCYQVVSNLFKVNRSKGLTRFVICAVQEDSLGDGRLDSMGVEHECLEEMVDGYS